MPGLVYNHTVLEASSDDGKCPVPCSSVKRGFISPGWLVGKQARKTSLVKIKEENKTKTKPSLAQSLLMTEEEAAEGK